MQITFFEKKSKIDESRTTVKALQVRNKNSQMIKSNNSNRQDYYSILKLEKNATFEEIKSAYRKLSLKYHPDKNKDLNAPAIFLAISNAYQVLSSPDLRAQYDRELYYSLEASSESELYHQPQLLGDGSNVLPTRIRMTPAFSYFGNSLFNVNHMSETTEQRRLRSLILLLALILPVLSDDENELNSLNRMRTMLLICAASYLHFSISSSIIEDEIELRRSLARFIIMVSASTSFMTSAALIHENPYFSAYHPFTSSPIFLSTPPSFDIEDNHSFSSRHTFSNYSLFNTGFFSALSPTISPSIELPKKSNNQEKLDASTYKGKIPEDFICPLSAEIMTNPVHNPEKGLPNVEKTWILTEINRTGLNPYNKEPLSIDDLIENEELKKGIDSFVKTAVATNRKEMVSNLLSFFSNSVSTVLGSLFQGSTITSMFNDVSADRDENSSDEEVEESASQLRSFRCAIM